MGSSILSALVISPTILLLPLFSALGAPFTFETVEGKAKQQASKAYSAPAPLEKSLSELDYDGYRLIRSSQENTLWAEQELPFRLQFMHPGYRFLKPVKMNIVDYDGNSSPLAFDKKYFDYKDIPELEKTQFDVDGFAGFRILHPLNDVQGQYDELGSFVGASYFRLLGKDQSYGISARGLALNSVTPGAAEEFPDFTEYWFIQPKPEDKSFTLYALLDSPSVTGAYRFIIHPGETTRAAITVSLFFRKEVKCLGLAPLTSMFWYGENHRERTFPDWRPEVHDSDGLLLKYRNQQTLWRPLYNHHAIRNALFNAKELVGYGLLQRDRDFNNYQDLGNPQHRAPSTWVEPSGEWPSGGIRLIELPTNNEAMDNIVSFYQPAQSPKAGDSLRYSYCLCWEKTHEQQLSPNQVIATRIEKLPGTETLRRFVLDFSGPDLNKLPDNTNITAEVSSTGGTKVTETQCFKNPHTGGWRVAFILDLNQNPTQPTQIHCLLKDLPNQTNLSEIWSYQWTP
ncbi:glucans biosynthesis protein [Rubritalea squalenifaciens DSM 18772]|uniref:Glucans biosynthesis protein G n=1 Tax=Rubritalea squalenifaciens DSM 18772 TaxID=1123071 RepID=A0A1M6QCB7_9BACT|nr:glucan biosynthesis protein G [Rubritalea squalenifaciens]SHK17929.1 glucans biosynthesis protein [Rubritalea squalenifaciens DSM 18772]